MSNSRLRLMTELANNEKPTNSSKGKGLILETPYKPGFVDDKDLESVKMAVDKELSDVANAFQVATERTADTITRVDKLEITGDNNYGEIKALIETVDKVSKEGDVALAQRITTFQADVATEFGKTNALITDETTARASADEAMAQRITEMKAEIDTDIGKNTALITSESTARVTADEAMAQRIDNILGSMEGDLGPLVGQIQTDLRVLADKDGVLAEKIETVTANYKQADKELDASIKEETRSRVTADEALAEQITRLRADVTTEDSKLSSQITNTNKVVTDLTQTVATNKTELSSSITSSKGEAISEANKQAQAALSTAQTALDKAIKDGDIAEANRLKAEIERLTGIIGGNKADIEAKLSQTNTTISNLDKAVASQKTELQSDYNGKIGKVTNELSTVSDKLGNVESKWGLQVQAGAVTGSVQLGATSGGTSEFAVRADKFVFAAPDGSKSPGGFNSSGGVTTFTGSLQVADQGGNVGMKITNSQILIYDDHGRLRVKLGRLS